MVRSRQAVAKLAYKNAGETTASESLLAKTPGVYIRQRQRGVATPSCRWRINILAILARSYSAATLSSRRRYYTVASLHVAKLSPSCRHAC